MSQQLELVALDGSKSQVPGNYTIVFTNGEDATVSVPIIVDAKEAGPQMQQKKHETGKICFIIYNVRIVSYLIDWF